MVEQVLERMVESGEIGMASFLRRRARDGDQSPPSDGDRFVALSGMTFVLAVIFGFALAKSSRSTIAFFSIPAVAIALACGFATLTDRCSADFGRIRSWTRGFLRGAALGLFVWPGTMFFAGMFGDFGDKFGISVIAMTPLGTVFGGLAGGIVALAFSRRSSSHEDSRKDL